ncbi:MAG TPA: S41 family peptidase [Chloroflexota bacterium]|nr:S41 family peptidase [Chloroflexota bacterium]
MQVTAARRAVLLCSLAATIFSGCAPQQAFTPRLTSDLVATPTPGAQAEAGGSRGGSAMSAEQSVSVVSQAYALLLQTYVEPADPVALLYAAWDGFAAALPADQPRPERPQLGGVDVREDLNRFRAAYLAAAAPAGGGNEGQARLAHAAVRSMASSVSDCHTAFTDPQQAEEQAARLRGDVRFGGVGIRIKRRGSEPLVIWELLDGGTAGKAGLKPGDAIVKVDGKETSGLPLDQVAALIRGPEGTQVKLTVERADGKRVQDVSLKRVQIAEPAFKSQLLPGNVPYLRLFSFSQNGQTDLLQAMREYEAKNPPGWIVDLRTNNGGELQVLLSLLSKFLKDGPFAYQVDRRGARAAFGPDGTYLPRQRPMVVLVSDSTSSAAELFAAAVQHFGAGTVVGTRTAGCLGIGNRFELADGSGLSVTVQKLLGPDGKELNKVGLNPTETVEVSRADLAAGRDPQLERALVLLGAKK